jgi:hypothetical protein
MKERVVFAQLLSLIGNEGTTMTDDDVVVMHSWGIENYCRSW